MSGNRGLGRSPNLVSRPREYLTPQEVEDLATAAGRLGRQGLRNKLLVLLCHRHGLRVSEALSLRWTDVDLVAKTLFVRRLKGGRSGTHPLSPREVRDLGRLPQGSSYVFASSRGQLDRSTVHKLLRQAGVVAGLPFPVHAHMLRHGCGYKLVNDGVDIRVVQEYLGHENIANTVVYTALSPARFVGLWRE